MNNIDLFDRGDMAVELLFIVFIVAIATLLVAWGIQAINSEILGLNRKETINIYIPTDYMIDNTNGNN